MVPARRGEHTCPHGRVRRTGSATNARSIRTPSGGEHLYFTAPAGTRLPSTKGSLAPRVDTRAWGGQVVAPGCVTPDGPYTVLDASPVTKPGRASQRPDGPPEARHGPGAAAASAE